MEIFHGGQWGSVCDDNWNELNAQVVCAQLGYNGGTVYDDNEYESSSGPIWLDEVNCNGYESGLQYCESNVYGENDCSNFEDVGIRCGKL